MRQQTKTKATYRDVVILVSMDRLNGKKMFACRNNMPGPAGEEQWFPTQGEAIAHERHVIDRKMGIVRD